MSKHQSCQSHCCVHHGCKYGHDDCPVVTKQVLQDFPCGDCPLSVEFKQIKPFHFEAQLGRFTLKLWDANSDEYVVSFRDQRLDIPKPRPLKNVHIDALAFAQRVIEGEIEELRKALPTVDNYEY